ncbi:hypothetical protein SNE40_001896 [Patella caerulea]|uniref:Uncharacterized protein n=1 Tax=Patella caerulea TaxID=87958 RepID=A0AAN8PYE3_PATCE
MAKIKYTKRNPSHVPQDKNAWCENREPKSPKKSCSAKGMYVCQRRISAIREAKWEPICKTTKDYVRRITKSSIRLLLKRVADRQPELYSDIESALLKVGERLYVGMDDLKVPKNNMADYTELESVLADLLEKCKEEEEHEDKLIYDCEVEIRKNVVLKTKICKLRNR